MGDTENCQMGLFKPQVKLVVQQASAQSLLALALSLDSGGYRIPPHQRKWRWTAEKKRLYISRVKQASVCAELLPGCIETYQFVDYTTTGVIPTSGIFLNDGVQRISTAIDYYKNPSKYGDSPQDAEETLAAVKYTTHHRHYQKHFEAVRDFWFVNYGLNPTPYEQCNGLLSYMGDSEGDDTKWDALFSSLHEIVKTSRHVVVRSGKRNDAAHHRFYRDDYGLFYRFIVGDRESISYNTSTGKIEIGQMLSDESVGSEGKRKRKVIELYLRDELLRIGIDESVHLLDLFRTFINRETALLADVLVKVNGRIGEAVTDTFYRWVLAVAIWRRNQKKSELTISVWEDFLIKLIINSGGSTTVKNEEKGIKAFLGLNRVDSVGRVCLAIDSDMYDRAGKVRRNRRPILPGFDNSHVLPFATNGEGPTFPEPSSRNRSRGSSPVIEDQNDFT